MLERFVVFKRFKSMWRGSAPAPSDDSFAELDAALADDGTEVDDAAEAEAAPVVEPPPDPLTLALADVVSTLERGDADGALMKTRALLLEAPAERRILRQASDILTAIGEDDLAAAFDAAVAQGEDTLPLAQLAEAFLQLDDADMAFALSVAARHRDPKCAVAATAFAGAALATGKAQRAIDALVQFAPQWPLEEMFTRYAEACVRARDWERYDRDVVSLAVDVPSLEVLTREATRVRAFQDDGDGETESSASRARYFFRFGTVLIDAVPAGGRVPAIRLMGYVTVAGELIAPMLGEDARLTYVSPAGEVFARWLADLVQRPVMPLSARLPDQPVAVVLADDADHAYLYDQQAFASAPVILVQILKDPAVRDILAPDVIGALTPGGAATLPLDPLWADKAAERLPPQLMARALREEAETSDEELDTALAPIRAWLEPRARYLSVRAPLWAGQRPWMRE